MDIDDLIDGLEIDSSNNDLDEIDIPEIENEELNSIGSENSFDNNSKDFKILYDLFIEISKALDVDIVINLIIDVIKKIIPYESCTLHIYESTGLDLKCSRNLTDEVEKNINDLIKENVVDWAINADKPVAIDNEKFEIIISPLIVDNNLKGVLGIFCKKNTIFSKHQMEIVSMLSTQAAIAIEKVILYEELEKKEDQLEVKVSEISELYDELRTVYDFSTGLDKILTIDDLMEYSLNMSIKIMESEKGIVYIYNAEDNSFNYMRSVKYDEIFICKKIKDPKGCLADFIEMKEVIFFNECKKEDNFYGFEDEKMLVMPFFMSGKLHGFLMLGVKVSNKKYTNRDKKLMEAVSTQISRSIDNLLLTQEFVEKEKIEKELDLATEIQANMLPDRSPEIEGYDISGKSLPARHVGGDYYDFIKIDDKHTGLFIGDVSGKGIPAALLMTMVKSVIKSESRNMIMEESIFYNTNNIISEDIYIGKFITMFYVILENTKSQLYYSNAGHNPMIIYRANENKMEHYDTEGFPIGVVPLSDFFVKRTTLDEGDIIFLYTDGISEAMNINSEEYGVEQLEKLIYKIKDLTADEMVEKIFEDVMRHAGEAPQHDDITLIVMKKNKMNNIENVFKKLQFNSNLSEVEQTVNNIIKEIRNYTENKEIIFEIKLSLNELFINAVKHGNKMNRSKKVIVDYSISSTKFELTIEDEGTGFEPEKIPNSLADENIQKEGGRGVLLVKELMNEMIVNKNKVRVIKLFC